MLKGWRVLGFNIATLALGAVQATDLATIIPAPYLPYAAAAVPVINIILRIFSTSTPVGTK